MKTWYKKILFILAGFFPSVIFAAGGGGGGSVPPSCEQDTWLCTEWSECSSQGEQQRSCQISFDCPSVNTQRPTEARTCTPPCTDDTWECGEWGECLQQGWQTRTCTLVSDCLQTVNTPPLSQRQCEPGETTSPESAPPPSPSPRNPFTPPTQPSPQKPSPSLCRVDRWDCGLWSETCDAYGNQKRSCVKTLDCPNTETPPPPFFKRCETLQCGNKETLRERALCRLNMTQAALTREYELEYLPEECRLMEDESRKNECVTLYASYRPCWEKPIGEARSVCARSILGLGQNIAREMSQCVQDNEKNIMTCRLNLRQKVYELIKFRLYDLEERAEDLIERGADKELIADFVVFITQSKDRFNKALTKEERKQIIMEVRREWKEFVKNVKIKMQISK